MKTLCMVLLVGIALLPSAVPAVAQVAPISDSMTVYAPDGSIFAQTVAFEPGEDVNTFYTVAVGIDPSQFGNPTVLVEPDGSFSDIFGVCNPGNGQLTLCFNSDSASEPSLPPGQFGTFPLTFPEGNGVFDATMYLSPDLQLSGWHATFVSDTEIPEPASLLLLGSGLMGLAGKLRRKLIG